MNETEKKSSIVGARPNYRRSTKSTVNALSQGGASGLPSVNNRTEVQSPGSAVTENPTGELKNLEPSVKANSEERPLPDPNGSNGHQPPAESTQTAMASPQTSDAIPSDASRQVSEPTPAAVQAPPVASGAANHSTLQIEEPKDPIGGIAHEPPAELKQAGALPPTSLPIDRAKLAKAVMLVHRAKEFSGKFQRVDYPKSMRERLAEAETLLSEAASEQGRTICNRDILLSGLDRLFAQFEKVLGGPLPKDKIDALEKRVSFGSEVLAKLRGLVSEVPVERDIDAFGVQVPLNYLCKLRVITTLLKDEISQRALFIQATSEFLKQLDNALGRKR